MNCLRALSWEASFIPDWLRNMSRSSFSACRISSESIRGIAKISASILLPLVITMI
ncbi:hypothetical protein D3C78_1551450 [compost metagenome]